MVNNLLIQNLKEPLRIKKEKVDLNILSSRLKTIESYGILNYYQSQRFGGIRLDSHKIGKMILQGNYEMAAKFLLFNTNDFEDDETHYFILIEAPKKMSTCFSDVHVTEEAFHYKKENPRSRWKEGWIINY